MPSAGRTSARRTLLRAFVGRGSHDPAQVPDRRSLSFGVCSDSANAFEARAYDEHGRPSVTHSGGVVRPAPNTENLAPAAGSAQRNRDERGTAATPTLHHPRASLRASRLSAGGSGGATDEGARGRRSGKVAVVAGFW